MKLKDIIHISNPEDKLIDFLRFTCKELKIYSLPTIKFLKKPIKSQTSISFAAYRPYEKTILIYTKNRHILDIFRSLAHEMVHYSQNLQSDELDGRTGSPHENEANAIAGQIMRKYNKLHSELF